MVQPVRPQDVSSLYRQQSVSTARGRAAAQPGAEPNHDTGATRSRADHVTLSDEAQQLRRVLDSMVDLPEVREQRIAFLRQQIDAGTYDRGIDEVAQRLIEEGLLS